jgi:hypothetical protein
MRHPNKETEEKIHGGFVHIICTCTAQVNDAHMNASPPTLLPVLYQFILFLEYERGSCWFDDQVFQRVSCFLEEPVPLKQCFQSRTP